MPGKPIARFMVIMATLLLLPIASCAPQPKPGFRVVDGHLTEPSGSDFVIRGVSYPYTWFPEQPLPFADIKSHGANAVRIVLSSGQRWRRTSASELERVIDACQQNRLVCVLEVHDTTGYGEEPEAASLSQAVQYWIEMKDELVGHEDHVMINVGNEPLGNVDPAPWARQTSEAIGALRAEGLTHALIVDAPNWGQDWQFAMRDSASTVFAADPARNTIFSVHMYEVFSSPATVEAYLDAFERARLPLIIGEFGPRHPKGDPDEDAIMAAAQARRIGYIGWSWSGNSGGQEYLDLVENFDGKRLTPWGERLFRGPNGIAQTAQEAAIYRDG